MVIAAVWLGSGFYRVQPDEQGIVMRFGAFRRSAPPGLNYHLPWPVESVLLPAVTRINRVEVGYRSGAPDLRSASGRDLPQRDVPEESLMLTGDENIIDIDFAVFWRISDAGAFLFSTRHPEIAVKSVAESVMREVIGRTPIQPALTDARAQIETSVMTGAQAILDQYHAGVEITQVQLQKVDPPAAVIDSFRDVQRANTEAERMVNQAQSYRNDVVPRARGDAAQIMAAADGARQASIAEATGQAQRFQSVLSAYQLAKEVTLKRLYIETMEEILLHTPTTIVDDGIKGLVPFLPLNDGRLPVPPAGLGRGSCGSHAMNRIGMIVIAAVFVAALDRRIRRCSPCSQTEQVLITQFGQPVRVIEKPGLHAKIPLVQTAISFDRRLLDYEVPAEEVILSDQRRLIVDSFARYRITDPLRYYQAVGPTEDGIRARLNAIVSSSLRRVLGNEKLLSVLSSDRGRIMESIRNLVNTEMRSFGVSIDDVRIRRADLPGENTQAILSRMQSERERVASQARAEGAEAAARIRADAERDRTVLLAQARGTADKLRGEGEQAAIGLYAAAFQKDPHFFEIWRSLQAYRTAFAGGNTRLVISDDSDFMKFLRVQPQPGDQAAGQSTAHGQPANGLPVTPTRAP